MIDSLYIRAGKSQKGVKTHLQDTLAKALLFITKGLNSVTVFSCALEANSVFTSFWCHKNNNMQYRIHVQRAFRKNNT